MNNGNILMTITRYEIKSANLLEMEEIRETNLYKYCNIKYT